VGDEGGVAAGVTGADESGRELVSWPRAGKEVLSARTKAKTTRRKYLRVILSILCHS
jgi:hypothetical protein